MLIHHQKAYEKLQKNGISFVETSASFSSAEDILKDIMEEVELGPKAKPIIASTFPNPWKYSLSYRTIPRYGAKAVVNAAEESLKRMGIFTMELYQVQNPWFYVGGSSALANGLLDVISDDHSRYVGVCDMSLSKLQKLQRKLRDQGEFVATHQFEFSLTNRKALGMIEACKKMGITPIARNVLDGGLSTGKYTSTNPTGGEVSEKEGDTGPFPLRKLEKLDRLFKAQESLIEAINKRIGSNMLRFDTGEAVSFSSNELILLSLFDATSNSISLFNNVCIRKSSQKLTEISPQHKLPSITSGQRVQFLLFL